METRILIVDDDASLVRQLRALFRPQGYTVDAVRSGNAAIARIGRRDYSLALVDPGSRGSHGVALAREIHEACPDTDVVMLAQSASIKAAVEAIKHGAADYLAKPVRGNDVLVAVERLLERRRVRDEARGGASHPDSVTSMVSRNPRMHEIFNALARLSKTAVPVLLIGEPGTGKDLCARALHDLGPRRRRRFVAVNCAALGPLALDASRPGELAGVDGGSPADLHEQLDLPRGGTLLLDKIESATPDTQRCLLPLLERFGAPRAAATAAAMSRMRLVAASNRPLAPLVARGALRPDLFRAADVATIAIPPLRERMEDVPLLAAELLRRSELAREKGVERVSERALAQLASHSWPGNVRELANVLERSVVAATGDEIREIELPGARA